MTPDELAKLKAALAAAGDHLVDAVSQVELAEVTTTTGAQEMQFDLFISYSAPKSSFTSSLLSGFEFYADFSMGKTSLVANILWHNVELSDYLEHAIIGHLSNGDALALAKLDAAYPTSDDSIIEVPAPERVDAAVYPDSILACNGRSLDSHNPWHLELSFEDYLAAERPDPSRPGSPASPGLSHSGLITMAKKAENSEEEAAPAAPLLGGRSRARRSALAHEQGRTYRSNS